MAKYVNLNFSCNEYYLMGKLLTDSYKTRNILGTEDIPNLNSMSIDEKGRLLSEFEEFLKVAQSISCIDYLVNFADNFDRLPDDVKGKYNNSIFNKLAQMGEVSNDKEFAQLEGADVLEAFNRLRNTDFFKSMLEKTMEHKDTLQERFKESEEIAEETLTLMLVNLDKKVMDVLVLPPEFFDVQVALR